MAEIIKARVWTKIDTLEAWDANPLILGPGEFAPVLTAPGGSVFNFKVGTGNRRFSDLPWSLQTPGAAQEANTSTVFPTGTPGLYIPTENGTYNGITVDLSAGYTQLIWDGATLVDVVFPILFDPSKDTMLYPNESGFQYGHLVNGKIFNNVNNYKWSGYLPIDQSKTIRFENMEEYTAAAFFDSDKEYISTVSVSSGTINSGSIPSGSQFVGINLYQGSNPDRSGVANIYVEDSIYDAANIRVVRDEAERYGNNVNDFELRHRIITIPSSEVNYSGGFVNGDTGYTQTNANRSKSRFYDIRQVSKIVMSGWTPTLPDSRWFYNENLQPLAKLTGVNGVFYAKDFPIGAVYFAFTTEMETIKLTGQEVIRFVYNGDSDNIYYYKRETYVVFDGSQSIDSRQLNAAGAVAVVAGSSWSGYVPVPEGVDLEISGIVDGLTSKFFYDLDLNVVGSITITNGVIPQNIIPNNAAFIGFNIRTPAAGDSRLTARMFYIEDDRGGGGHDETLPLAIPSVIPVVIGIQGNIYKDNIRPNPINDTTELFFNEGVEITTTRANPYMWKTRELERSVQYMPEEAEVVPMFARLRDRHYNTLTQRDFSFVGVPANAGNGQRKTIILAGDSQIDTSFDGAKSSFAPFMKDLFDQSGTVDMVFVGQESMNAIIYGETVGNNRTVSCPTEGHSGTRLSWLLGNQSPFWNPSISDIDLQYYFENAKDLPGNPYGLQPGDTLDFFLCPSGSNDFTLGGASPEQVVNNMRTLQSKVLSSYPNCKFIVGIPTLGSKLWSMDTRRRWSISYYRALINEFEKPEYSGKVYLAAAALWTDNIFGSRQLRKIVEPYQRIVDTKTLLINKAVQGGATPEEAEELVNDTYNLKVEERVFQKWTQEYPNTNDVTHSSYVSAMQQADCYYSLVKYILS